MPRWLRSFPPAKTTANGRSREVAPGKPNMENSTQSTDPQNDARACKELRASIIAVQNDLFRQGMSDPKARELCIEKGIKGRVMLTPGVTNLDLDQREKLITKIANTQFIPEGNDPYEERDFSKVEVGNTAFFWKIDLYDLKYLGGSEEPWRPQSTRRVLTIMEVSEY